MLRLLVLGGATVVDESTGGAPVATPRQTVGLVAALSLAGSAGLSRDKLVALFWPDAESERARHALTQAMYAARRTLGCDDLFIVGADVRLNDARITSDVADFERALAAGELETASTLYRGPFLDGFFVSGASEFERWTSTERTRLEDSAALALTRLASAARASDDPRASVDWLKRLATMRPLDSGVAVSLMEAMARAGDRAGALQYANVHRTLLRQELEIEPDAAVDALVRRLRDQRTSGETPARDIAEATHPSEATPARSAEPGIPEPGKIGRPRGRSRLVRSVLAAVLFIAGGFAGGRALSIARSAPPPMPTPRVVVAPFRVTGTTDALAYLREGLVELLSTRLTDDSTARSIDPGAVLSAWRAAGISTSSDVTRDTVGRIAARLGAERVIVGSVVGTPRRLIVRATALRVPTMAVVADATIEGSADSLATIVDRLAAKLLVAEAGEDDRVATQTTRSLPALRAYLAGQAAFRRNNYASALREYARALARDSTFALAALRLAVTADRADASDHLHRGLVAAWRYRDALGDGDRALLGALAGGRFPAPSTAAAQIDAWQRVVDLAPRSAEAWFALGTRLFHDGAIAGVETPERHSRVAFERALAADPSYTPAARFLALLAAREATHPSEPSASGLWDSLSPLAPFVRWRLAVERGDENTLKTIRATFPRIPPANLRAILMASQFDAVGISDADRALRTLREKTPGTVDPSELVFAEHSIALNRGRSRDALDATTRLQSLMPGSHAHLRLRVLDGLYGDGDSTAAEDAVRELAGITAAGRSAIPATLDSWLADLCVVTQWRLSHSDTTGAARAVNELRAAPLMDRTMWVVASPSACAELLEVQLAVVLRQRDARARLARLDSLAFTPRIAGDAAAYAPLLIARLHERLGDANGALVAVRRRAYMTGWPRYLASMLREEQRLAELTLDVDGAREASRRYVALRHADDADENPRD